jgi:hypothetical protein
MPESQPRTALPAKWLLFNSPPLAAFHRPLTLQQRDVLLAMGFDICLIALAYTMRTPGDRCGANRRAKVKEQQSNVS